MPEKVDTFPEATQATSAARGRRARTWRWLAVPVLVIVAAWLGDRAYRGATPVRKQADPNRASVLLIVIDTLRVDRLGCYGSDLRTTPRLDTFAAQAVRFEQAYAHAPWTLPSFASLLTSLSPPQHGAGGPMSALRGLRRGVRTVAECFRDAGYATASIVNVDYLGPAFGLTRGFEHVDFEAYPQNEQVRDAMRTTDAALKWLAEPSHRPFFLMVHYFDPHLVYAPPPEFRRRFALPQDQEEASWVFGTREQMFEYRKKRVAFDRVTIRRAEALYNGEVAYTDQQVGRLLDGLGELGLAKSTVVVITADHGEEFLDHGGFEHGHTLYNELVRVPLLLRYPGLERPIVVGSAVGHIDVAPTVCALAEVPPATGFAGRSLVPVIERRDDSELALVLAGNTWGAALRGWLAGGHKLIDRQPGAELYNIRQDPAETNDLSKAAPDLVRQLSAAMGAAFELFAAQVADEAPAPVLTPDEIDRLRSLGYVR